MRTDEEISLRAITSVLAELLQNDAAVSSVHEGTRLVEDLGLDSVSVMALAFLCEERFAVRISDRASELPALTTVGGILELLRTLRVEC